MTKYTKGCRSKDGTFSNRLQNVDDMGPVSIFKYMPSLQNGHQKYDFRRVSTNTD